MCGIAGIVARGPTSLAREALSHVEAMAARMRHRGPDSSGSWAAPSGRCVLGHSRLAVIDLETGGQPIVNETGSIATVVNGMIYNYQSLRSRLKDRGHVFRSTGDCEVVVHAYEELLHSPMPYRSIVSGSIPRSARYGSLPSKLR